MSRLLVVQFNHKVKKWCRPHKSIMYCMTVAEICQYEFLNTDCSGSPIVAVIYMLKCIF